MLLCRAYAQTSSCRSLGYGVVGPVPMTAVWTWCDRNGIEGTAARITEDVIALVDAETLRRQRTKK